MRTLIIGGGLAGLALADMLEGAGREYVVIEARARFGGRILTQHFDAGYFDMGPAWFWPGQPRIAALIDRFNLEKFDQFYEGMLCFEDEQGAVQHGRGFASMQGSWRLKGGLGALTDVLAARVPDSRKRLSAGVTALCQSERKITATLTTGKKITGGQAVLALPPRVAAEIAFSPSLPDQARVAMQNTATWMAGQAKAVAVYDRPFWREAGLSGDAQSRHGPMVEIHDASLAQGGPYAVFGFIGVPPQGRVDEQVLRRHLCAQLGRLFGPQAATPKALFIKDWACDPQTSTPADQAPLSAHPVYGMPSAMSGLWEGRLLFGGTEVARQFGGYIEGALEAAEHAFGTMETYR